MITHSGWNNFAVHTLNKTLKSTDLLVNKIGNYSGTVLFDGRTSTDETTALKITADGAWTVKLVPFSSIRSFDGSTPMTGHGDDVLAYTGTVVWAPGIYEVTADGDWSATLR